MWGPVFQQFVGDIPPHFDIYMSAQFLVSRDNVRALPLAFYENYYRFLTDATISAPTGLAGPDLSIVCEHVWTFIMNRQAYTFTDSFPSGEEELCANLDTCPIPSVPAIPPAVREQENGRQHGFYPCGSAFPAAPAPSPATPAPSPAGPSGRRMRVWGGVGRRTEGPEGAEGARGFGPHERWLHLLSPEEVAGGPRLV